MKNFKSEPVIKALLSLPLNLCGITSLLLSHLCWTSLDGQALFSSREIVKRLVSLMDFNELVNEGEAESSLESLMEISFYALLALINMTHDN